MLKIDAIPVNNVLFFKGLKTYKSTSTHWNVTQETNAVLVWRGTNIHGSPDWNYSLVKAFDSFNRNDAIEFCVVEALAEQEILDREKV